MSANNGTRDESQDHPGASVSTGTTAPDGAGGTNEDPVTEIAHHESLHPNGSPLSKGGDATVDIEAQPPIPTQRQIHSIFSSRTKKMIVAMTALGTIFSPLSSTIYLPALNTLSSSLHVSIARINLTVTSYMIFQGLAPMFFGDFADMAGRRPAYIIAFIIYFFANLGLALQNSYAGLFVLRALQSTGSSGTVALGNGVMADIVTSAERGSYIGWVQSGAQIGPALAPTIGGLLTQFLGWRAIFWFLLIAGGLYLLAYFVFIPETGRNVVGNGSIPPKGWNKSLLYYLQMRKAQSNGLTLTVSREEMRLAAVELAKTRKLRFPNPLRALLIIVEKDVALILFFTSLMVTAFQCLLIGLPSIVKSVYGFNDLQIGLCYIPFSVGSAIGSIVCGRFLDYNYKRVARQIGVSVDRRRGNDLRHFPIERARLEVIWYPLVLGCCTVIAWGWSLQAHTSLAAPLIVLFFAGFFLSGALAMLSTLLVDLYPQNPATATAALNLTRCLMSAAGTAVIQYIIDAMGIGWCYTFLGLLTIAFSPCLWVVMRWGPEWREERFVRELKRKEAKTASEEAGKSDKV